MKTRIKIYFLLSSFFLIFLAGCQKDQLLLDLNHEAEQNIVKIKTRAVTPYLFDWENADWMPTPQGQSSIPSPWVGQGCKR